MAQPEKIKAKEAPSRKLDRVRVLLVEDERIIREIVVRLLKAIGVREVTEAATAEDGWRLLVGQDQQTFHVLITDLTLPGASGGTLVKKLRELPYPRAKTFPVIVLTGSNDLETYKLVEPWGISSYLIKPVSADLLRSAIEKAVFPETPKEPT